MDFFQRCYIFFHLLANKHTLVEYLKVFSSINLYSNRFIVVKITFLLHNKQQEITSVKSFVILSSCLLFSTSFYMDFVFLLNIRHTQTNSTILRHLIIYGHLFAYYLYQYLAVMMLF